MKYKCFNPIQSVTIKSGSCILCPSMDLIAFFGSDRVIVQRTVSWQRVAVVGYSHVQALAWSPDGSLLALARKEGGYVLSNVELGMTEGEDESVVHRLLTGPRLEHLVWARIGNSHVGWIVTQQERERDAMWSYRSPYLDRSTKFLPPTSYIQGDMTNTEETVRKSNPTCKSALSILCAATSFDGIRLYIHGRYPIVNLKCTPVKEMTLSRDLSYLSVLQDCHKMIIFSIPAFVQHRYSLQTITALYSSLQSHLHTIKEALPNVLSSWKNTLRPLDTKIDALSSILKKYGVDSSVCSVLFKYILLGKSSNHFNALEQFFSGVQMNDQLFVRMEKTLHNGLANVETLTRSVLLAPALSLALEVNQLYGLEDELLPHTEDLMLRVRYLLHSIEHLVLRIVEARFRLRDVCSWFRSAASEIKAIGTAPDSVESDNSRKRRVPQELLNRVTDYFQEPNLLDEGQSPTEALIHSYVTALISHSNTHVPHESSKIDSSLHVKTALFESEGIRTLASALDLAESSFSLLFEQPKACVQNTISKTEILFSDSADNICALHSRTGIEKLIHEDEPSRDGSFFPINDLDDCHFSFSRQWTVLAVSCKHNQGIRLILIPLGSGFNVVLTKCLVLPENCRVTAIAFYGDDGLSSRSSGDEKTVEKEGRQALGLLVQHESELQLWILSYDSIQFSVANTRMAQDKLDIRNLDMITDASIPILPNCEDDDSNPNFVTARVRIVHSSVQSLDEAKLHLCGSRGVGGVVTFQNNGTKQLQLFDLEEDEDLDDEMEDN